MEDDIQVDVDLLSIERLSIISENISIVSTERTSLYSVDHNKEALLKKCIRKGDNICYSKLENINMLQNSKQDDKRKSSFDADQVDKVLSGESLYKGSNDEETDKCIAFWRSVMEKNLAPIKCTIIENGKIKEVPDIIEKESATVLDDERLKSETAKIHEEYKNMWITLLNELQKKRLHEIKLIGKSRCKMCDSSFDENLDKINKSEVEKEIIDLNNWDPDSKGKGKSTYTSKLSERGSIIKNRIDSKLLIKATSQAKPPVMAKEDTNKYKHIDVIQEKRNSGAYSKWRSNKVESPCPCGYPDCDCNINPAIVSVETPSELQLKESKESISDKQESNSSSDIDEERIIKSAFKSHSGGKLKKTLSVMLHCTCSSEDCDCEAQKEVLEKISVPLMDDFETLEIPERKVSVGPVSSLELLQKKFRSPERILKISDEIQESEIVDYEDESEDYFDHANEKGNKETSKMKKCICSDEECDCDKEELQSELVAGIKKCACSDPACDCEGKKMEIEKLKNSLGDSNGFGIEVEENVFDLSRNN